MCPPPPTRRSRPPRAPKAPLRPSSNRPDPPHQCYPDLSSQSRKRKSPAPLKHQCPIAARLAGTGPCDPLLDQSAAEVRVNQPRATASHSEASAIFSLRANRWNQLFLKTRTAPATHYPPIYVTQSVILQGSRPPHPDRCACVILKAIVRVQDGEGERNADRRARAKPRVYRGDRKSAGVQPGRRIGGGVSLLILPNPAPRSTPATAASAPPSPPGRGTTRQAPRSRPRPKSPAAPTRTAAASSCRSRSAG